MGRVWAKRRIDYPCGYYQSLFKHDKKRAPICDKIVSLYLCKEINWAEASARLWALKKQKERDAAAKERANLEAV